MSQSTSGETQVGWTACGDRLSRRRFGADGLVRTGGLEPPRPLGHWDLNPARLPVPPRPRCADRRGSRAAVGGAHRSRQSMLGMPQNVMLEWWVRRSVRAGRYPRSWPPRGDRDLQGDP